MRSIETALQAAEERKHAIFGHAPDEDAHLARTDQFGEAAIFSGLGLDMEELRDVSLRAAALYSGNAATQGLIPLFQGTFCDGLLIGMLLARQPDE